MYTLCLDLHLRFVPPMSTHAPGIVLTRTLTLPFPPYSGLIIHGQAMDECPDPLGFHLTDVIWDMDREVFLAHTIVESSGEPLAFIPDTIRGWIGCGWKLGSYRDDYTRDYEAAKDDESGESSGDESEYDRMEKLHTLPKSRRDPEFNRFFKALIREMSDGYNNLSVAYAMDKLGRLLSDEEPKAGEHLSDAARLWQDACSEFDQLDPAAQTAWQDKVAKYPSLERALGLVAPRGRGKKNAV